MPHLFQNQSLVIKKFQLPSNSWTKDLAESSQHYFKWTNTLWKSSFNIGLNITYHKATLIHRIFRNLNDKAISLLPHLSLSPSSSTYFNDESLKSIQLIKSKVIKFVIWIIIELAKFNWQIFMTFMKSYINKLRDWANLIKTCTLSKIEKMACKPRISSKSQRRFKLSLTSSFYLAQHHAFLQSKFDVAP